MNEFNINQLQLDQELIAQPGLAYQYAQHAAECRKAVDIAQNQLAVIRGTLAASIRQNPEDYDLTKTTDSIVEQTIPIQTEYQEAYQNLTNAKYNLRMAEAAVTAVDHKKRSMQELVSLLNIEYWHASIGLPETKPQPDKRPARRVAVRNKIKNQET